MSEPHGPPAAAGESAAGESAAAEPEKPATPRSRRIAIGLAGAGLLAAASAVAVVATLPSWAPLMPWRPAPPQTDAAPVGRPDRTEAAPPATRLPDRPKPDQPAAEGQPETAAANPALQLLDRRVGALEARPAAPASAIAEIRQLLATLTSKAADLDARVEAIAKAVSTAAAADATDMALVLALLQIRGALELGRPFAAEYDALAALARARPAIAAAAAPLAEPAKTGLATRAVLAARLRELAGAIATAKAPATAPENAPAKFGDEAAPDWVDQALMHLRGLVTIRRIDGAGPETAIPETKVPEAKVPEAKVPETAAPGTVVKAADLALAGGDLDGAVAALGKLTGASEAVARPWLRMARERLAAEAAVHRIEALLVARLGSPATAAPAIAPPATAPAGAGSPR